MPYEVGGRADKSGNRYEIKWFIYQMLKVLEEKIYSVTLEAIGDEEKGIDVWVNYIDDKKEGQQCKGRNGSNEKWTISSMKSHDICSNWKLQLDRDGNNRVSLVSPLSCSLLQDLIDRANNNDGNYQHFYQEQICKSSVELQKFYSQYTEAMDLDIGEKHGIIKSIDYLKRTHYRQVPDFQLKDSILDKIKYLFVGNEKIIYDILVSMIVDGDILGKQLTSTLIYDFLKEKGIKLRDLASDERIYPRIQELNIEYRQFFKPINEQILERKEFEECRKAIFSGESIIIHGKAGSGKSGCTEAIMDYCETNNIPIIALKLDKRIPKGSAENWGKEIGLPASIIHCIHSISKNEKAVVIFDQLDALRWTQSHSRDSLIICSELINQIIKINNEREQKISVVFVCRTYDLENDNNIKSLFKSENDDLEIVWKEIKISDFNEETVKKVVGERYSNLSHKLKNLLKTPSNLYIWSKLDPYKDYNECSTTSHLILRWWDQLKTNCICHDEINERDLNETKENLVEKLYKLGRISIPKTRFNHSENALKYLSSNGFLIMQNNNVSFSHQSILDYFLAEVMIDKFYDGEELVNIIGDKDKQTPGCRYQVQMLLENLLDTNTSDFINFGKNMIESDQVRYYVKHVFFEVLGQIDNIDEDIKLFILENYEDSKYKKYILNNVIRGHDNYIRLLRDNGIFDILMKDINSKEIVLNLLASMTSRYDLSDVEFIRKYMFISKADDEKIFRNLFWNNIDNDTDEMFELRFQLYEKYPEMLDIYFDLRKLFQKYEMRAIRIFELLLKYKIRGKEKFIYKDEVSLLDEIDSILITNAKKAIDLLLGYIPCDSYENIRYSEWVNMFGHKRNLERTCIEIIKKANKYLILDNPDEFIKIYKEYMGSGFAIFNEIILDSLRILPERYSDFVISYLCEDFDKNIFDKTSGSANELLLVKNTIEKHAFTCSDKLFSLLENRIIHYISPESKERYMHRINYNKENKSKVYWSFWGDLQVELLSILPIDRMSQQAKDLLSVLKRKFKDIHNIYDNSNNYYGGWVRSPISGKKLSDKSWIKLLTNKKLENIRYDHCKSKQVKGGLIESSIEEFASDFQAATSLEPDRMIRLVLKNKEKVISKYVDSLFRGICCSKNKELPIELLEEIIKEYPSDNKSIRARDICDIIRDQKYSNWSQEILSMLKDIAINHINPEKDKPVVTSNNDNEMKSFDMLQNNAINCVRGCAAFAIGNLLWENKKLYSFFKSTIEKLIEDENPAVKLASLYALWPSYNIDREWAAEQIINLYEEDYRFVGFQDSKNMLFRLYPQYKDKVLNIILKCYKSEDKDIRRVGCCSLVEMYILKGEFENEIINNIDKMTQDQVQEILQMITSYFDEEEYNDLCKDIVYKIMLAKFSLEFFIARIFNDNKINLQRDKKFLIDLVQGNSSNRLVYSFIDYLEKNAKSIVDYGEIILTISNNLISNKEESSYYELDEISKLIIGLYDETSTSSKLNDKETAKKCLDIWDLMFENQIGSIRTLSKEIFER